MRHRGASSPQLPQGTSSLTRDAPVPAITYYSGHFGATVSSCTVENGPLLVIAFGICVSRARMRSQANWQDPSVEGERLYSYLRHFSSLTPEAVWLGKRRPFHSRRHAADVGRRVLGVQRSARSKTGRARVSRAAPCGGPLAGRDL